MIIFAKPGGYCRNDSCLKYRQLEENPAKPKIIKAGQTKAGVQRYECKTCHQIFTITKGTMF